MNARAPEAEERAEGRALGSLPQSVALKEWALVCDLLTYGHQITLIRKGGIHEPHRGPFTLEHEAFLLYPNAEHQSASLVHPPFQAALRGTVPTPRADDEVTVPGWCQVTDVLPLADATRAHALTAHTCWNDAFFDQRLAYKPERPLLLILTRAYRLPTPLRLPYHKAYAGCRSWVPLRDTVARDAIDEAVPALDDATYEIKRQTILSAVA